MTVCSNLADSLSLSSRILRWFCRLLFEFVAGNLNELLDYMGEVVDILVVLEDVVDCVLLLADLCQQLQNLVEQGEQLLFERADGLIHLVNI